MFLAFCFLCLSIQVLGHFLFIIAHYSQGLKYCCYLLSQVRTITSYLTSKPPLMVSLTDLINLDLARTIFLGCSCLVAGHLSVAVRARLPESVASVLVFLMRTSLYGILLFLTIGIAVQYAHVVMRSASLFETTSDETIQKRIRIAVWTISFLLGLGNGFNSRPSALQVQMTGREVPAEDDVSPSISIIIMLVLAILCFFTNLLLRGLIYLQKKDDLPQQHHGLVLKRHVRSPQQEQQLDNQPPPPPIAHEGVWRRIPLCTYLLASMLLLGVLVVLIGAAGPERRVHKAPTAIGLVGMCIMLPGLLIASDKGMRAYARKSAGLKLTNVCPITAPFFNQVSPA